MEPQAPPAKKVRSAAQINAFERCLKAREEAILKKHSPATVTQAEPEPEPEPTESEGVPAVMEQGPQAMEEDKDEGYMYFDFDPESMYEKMAEARAEITQLREAVSDLTGRHDELHGSFQKHGVRQANALNFV